MTASFLGEDYLEIRDLTVDFDGFKAIHGVDLTFLQGRLHFLIGPNGAGKTTLVDALTGLVHGTGEAKFRNHDLLTMKSHQIVRLGIGRTFQTATRVRAAQRPAEPRHRRRAAPQGAAACCSPAARCPSASSRRWRPSA